MIDRVAQRLAAALKGVEMQPDDIRRLATEAVAAIREPILEAIHSQARLGAGNDPVTKWHNKTVYEVKANVQTMIDAALRGEQP